MAAVRQADGNTSHVHTGDSGALHGDSHAHSPDFSIAHISPWVFVFPANHLGSPVHALLHMTALKELIVVGRHPLAFPHKVHPADLKGIDPQNSSRLVEG